MSGTQVSMAISNFFVFFSRNNFLEWGFTFNRGGFIFKWGAPHGGGINFDGGGGLKKIMGNHGMGGRGHPPPPPLWEILIPSLLWRVHYMRDHNTLGESHHKHAWQVAMHSHNSIKVFFVWQCLSFLWDLKYLNTFLSFQGLDNFYKIWNEQITQIE